MGLEELETGAYTFPAVFQFGCFTFGGGWSIVAQMQKLYVEREKTITSQELLDITSVGRSLPGTMIGNVAFLYGYRVGGLACAAACVIAMVIPPMIVLSVITYFYTLFRENLWVMRAMTARARRHCADHRQRGRQSGQGGLPLSSCVILAAAAFGLYLFFNVSCVTLVVIGVISGILICEYYERRGTDRRDSDPS